MKLIEYIKTMQKAELEEFAKRCGTSSGQLKQVAGGHRRCGESLAINIDRETNGAVTCEQLRPDVDWAHLRATETKSKPKPKTKAA